MLLKIKGYQILKSVIAEQAKKVFYGDLDIKGFGNDSIIGEVDMTKPFTKIYRTNTNLLLDGIDYLAEGYSVKFEVDVRDFNKVSEIIKKCIFNCCVLINLITCF